jgi:hypothetical protein
MAIGGGIALVLVITVLGTALSGPGFLIAAGLGLCVGGGVGLWARRVG